MSSRTIFYDIELTRDCFIIGAVEDGIYSYAIVRDRADTELIETLKDSFRRALLVGFNNLSFDTHLLEGLLRGWTTEQLHELAQDIIGSGDRSWQVAQRWKVNAAPFDELDLMHYIPRHASLKVLEARLKMRHVIDMPFNPHATIDDVSLPGVLAYNEHDCRATATLHGRLTEEIATRQALASMFGNTDLLRKLPASAAEAAIMGEYEARSGDTRTQIKARARKMLNCRFTIRPAPWLRDVVAGSPETQRLLDAVDGSSIEMIDGIRQVPVPPLPASVDLGGLAVAIGVGGLHSIDGPGRADSDEAHTLWNVDVASYYPGLMMKLAGAPVHLDGVLYRSIYGGILERRLAAKQAGRKVEANALKLVVNSLFGKQNERHSPLYSPPSFLSITLNGQLCLMALIERIQNHSDAEVISANTDGLLIRLPRRSATLVDRILRGWEKETGFNLERTELARYRRLNVNSYISVDLDDRIVAKGVLGYSGGLETDHRQLIVAEAVAKAMHGVSADTTIRAAAERRDLSVFVDTLTTKGGGFVSGGTSHGRVIRVYRSIDPLPPDIFDTAKGKVPDRHMARGCRVVEDLGTWPDDIDVGFYIRAAEDLLEETSVRIDRGRTALARRLEQAGLRTLGEGGAKKVSTGGDFSGSASIRIVVADKDDVVIVAPGTLPADSLVLAVNGGEDAEVHRKSQIDPATLAALRKKELARRKAAGIGNSARKLMVWSEDGIRFRLLDRGQPPESTPDPSESAERDSGGSTGKIAPIAPVKDRVGDHDAGDGQIDLAGIDNETFVKAMFRDMWQEAFIVAGGGDPARWKGWGGGPVWASSNAYCRPGTNNYVSISLFGRSELDNKYHRRTEQFIGTAAVMIDDIGTKGIDPRERGWGEPSAVVETSPGNHQYLYFFDRIERDRIRAKLLIDMIVSGGETALGDPGAGNIDRVARLPDGINGKEKYRVNGEPFHCRLVEWRPETRYSPDSIAAWCGQVLPEAGAYQAFEREQTAVAGIDEAFRHPVVTALRAEGRHVADRLNARGWIDIECLWMEQHTPGSMGGTAIRILEGGEWSYNCHHGHCAERKTRAAWQRLAELGHDIPPPGAPKGSSFEEIEIDDDVVSAAEIQDVGESDGEIATGNTGGRDNGEDVTSKNAGTGKLTVSDFVYLSPVNKLIYRPSGELWARPGVDSRLPKVMTGTGSKAKALSPSAWIAIEAAVEGMTWDAAAPEIIKDRLYLERGVVARRGARVFNLFRAPPQLCGNAALAGPWINHVKKVYPDDWQHICDYLAHLLQHIGLKINHCLVLGGRQGVGKDTILVPIVAGLGEWNCAEIAPDVLFRDFNEYVRSLLVRISEARDNSEVDRYQFYERTKTLFAAPPDMLRVNTKFVPAYYVPNVAGTIITTNSKETGLYLPSEDRRHHIAWSDLAQEDFDEDYFPKLHRWYESGGIGHVVAFLKERDISAFNPKAPPTQTPAFWDIVEANRSDYEDRDGDAAGWLLELNEGTLPRAVSINWLVDLCERSPLNVDLGILKHLNDIKGPKRRLASMFFAGMGYVRVHNPQVDDGRWIVGSSKVVVYARTELDRESRLREAEAFAAATRKCRPN